MIARVARVTPWLLALLRSRNDDGTLALRVTRSDEAVCYRCSECGHETGDPYDEHQCSVHARIATVFSVVVTRRDGSELTATERQHVAATLAAHAVTPIQ